MRILVTAGSVASLSAPAETEDAPSSSAHASNNRRRFMLGLFHAMDRDRFLGPWPRRRRLVSVPRADVVGDDLMKLFGDALAFQRHRLVSIDIDRGDRNLAGSG